MVIYLNMFGRKEIKTIKMLEGAKWGMRKAYENDLIVFSAKRDFDEYADAEIRKLENKLSKMKFKQ